jgi:type II secretory pathway pseudopilin PulG
LDGPAPVWPWRRGLRPARRLAGFTYVGLLITIALMTSSLAVVAPVWEVASRRNKETELLFVGGEFRRALIGYAKFGTSDADRYPKTLEDLVKDPRFAGNRRLLRRVYRDPITDSTDWGLLRNPQGGITAVFSKSEKEPLKQANFSKSDKDFEGKTKYAEWVFSESALAVAAKAGEGKAKSGDPAAKGQTPIGSVQFGSGKPAGNAPNPANSLQPGPKPFGQ